MVVAVYTLEVDLDNSATYDGGAETVTGNVTTADGSDAGVLFKTQRGGDGANLLTRPKAGQLDFMLNNGADGGNGTYSPGGNLIGGRRTRLTAVYSGVTYRLWSGLLRTPVQVPDRSRKAVAVTAYGALAALAGTKVSTRLYATITTDVAIGYLLDAAGLTAPTRTFDTGKTTLDWYWEDEADAFTALQMLLDTEGPGSCLYEAGDGSIVFKNRTARATSAASNTSNATLSGSGSEPLITGATYDPGVDTNLYNAASLTVKTRTTQALQVVWTLGEAITLAAGEVRTYVARGGTTKDVTTGQYIGPFTGALAPVAVTDYTLSSGSIASITLSRTSGASTTITITAGASGAVIASGMTLRAQPVTVTTTTTVANQVDASASIAKYGTRPWPTDAASGGRPIRPEISSALAQAACDAIVGWYKDGRPMAIVQLLANGDATRMVQALARQVGDRVTLVEGWSGVSADFYVERVDHEVRAPGRHVTTLYLSQALVRNYGIWDKSKWDGGDLWAW